MGAHMRAEDQERIWSRVSLGASARTYGPCQPCQTSGEMLTRPKKLIKAHAQRGHPVAATTKDELLTVTKKEFDKLDKLLVQVNEQTALVRDENETSVKDIVGHRAHWISLFFGWYHDGLDRKGRLPSRRGLQVERPGRWAEAAGPRHYRSAAKYIRSRGVA